MPSSQYRQHAAMRTVAPTQRARAGRICSAPRCPNVQPCPTHARKPFASARRSTNLYGTQRWKDRRAAQLRSEPNCRNCGARAHVADHIEPHRGDEAAFFNGPLQSLCWPCSNAKTGRGR